MRVFVECFIKIVRKRIRYMSRERKRLWLVGIMMLIIGGILGGKIGGAVEKKRAEKELVEVTAELKEEETAKVNEIQDELDKVLNEEEEELPWNLVLVNYNNPMEEG